MIKRRALVAQALLIVAVALPAHATDETVQILSEAGGADDMLLGLDSEGTATAVWSERGEIRTATRLEDGKFGSPVPVPGFDLVDQVVFAEAPDGSAIIVAADNGAGAIVASVRADATSGFEPGVQVALRPSGNFFGSPDVAISESGRAVVTWLQTGAGVPTVLASIFDGSTFSAAAPLDEGDSLDDPNAGIDAAGNALVVWAQESATEEAILGATAPAGEPFGAPITIEQLTQGGGNDPDLAVNAAGDAVLAYEDGITTAECQVPSCSLFRVETRYGDVSGTFGAVQPTPLDNESGYGPGDHEVAIDDSGRAGLLLSMSTPNGYQVLGRTSDESGVFGPQQTISPAPRIAGPGVGLTSMDIAAGGEELTVVFINDHNADGQSNEVYRSHTTGGTFGDVHQLSVGSGDDPGDAVVARNDAGAHVAGWDLFLDEFGETPHAVPVGTGPALTQGTETRDNLKGSSGEDVVRLGAGGDKFNALGGADHVQGEGGNDVLKGGGGADVLEGGPGKDRLIGGGGVDLLDGGPGKDTCVGTKAEKKISISCEKFLPITV